MSASSSVTLPQKSVEFLPLKNVHVYAHSSYHTTYHTQVHRQFKNKTVVYIECNNALYAGFFIEHVTAPVMAQ